LASIGIFYTGEEQGTEPLAVALASWQSFALGVLAFTSVVTMGLIGVLAVAVRVGMSVEVISCAGGGKIHNLRAVQLVEW
jgi:hypothetical protein